MAAQKLESEKVVLAAPMSLHGSAARIWKLTEGKEGIAKVGLGALAFVLIAFAWIGLILWNLVLLVFFWFFLIPYRLVRRGQRKRKMEELRHRELLATSTAAVAATTPALAPPAPADEIETQPAAHQIEQPTQTTKELPKP